MEDDRPPVKQIPGPVIYEKDPFFSDAPPIVIDSLFSFKQFPPYVAPMESLSRIEKIDGKINIIQDDPLRTYYSFPVQLIYYFGIGLLFSPFSGGIRFYVLYSLAAELWYAYRIGGKYTPPQMIYRLGLFAVGFVGFILGRLIMKDRYPLRPVYSQQICKKQIDEDIEEERSRRRKKKQEREGGSWERGRKRLGPRNEERGREERGTRDEENK